MDRHAPGPEGKQAGGLGAVVGEKAGGGHFKHAGLLSSSASSTPGSEPQKTSRGSPILRMAAHVALIPPVSWITTPAYSTPCLEWPRSSAGHASLHTQMMRSPWVCWAW